MAGSESRHERRRFITRHHVEDASASGQQIRVGPRDVVTDEAAQRAMDLGVRIERETSAGSRPAPAASPATTSAVPASPEDLRRAVRAAVVAELGREPDGLDAAIARVMERRGR
jgi:hypothetical protein